LKAKSFFSVILPRKVKTAPKGIRNQSRDEDSA
jgi:hypothetical protein